ncbi:ATP-binding protein [Alienimonas californiensis]|uniref:histidine kinase n=1 Tax=Alienimonas californiensis TaxID=2527989 RepID=A0A517PBE1_9PLAN|nr:ATP-binding protein [Alienimonas californiensis]QDT16704.1 Phytochrome-like protein cph1 [Alienimonas californiensis]
MNDIDELAARPPGRFPGEAELEAMMRECASEPIRTPGSIQPHGALLAVDDALRITRASRNLAEFTGVAAEAAVGQPLDAVLRLPEGYRFDPTQPRRGATVIVARPRGGDDRPLRTALHRAGEETILEFAPAGEPRSESADGGRWDESYGLAGHLMERTRGVTEVETLCEIATEVVRAQIGFDHVMAYRFDEEFNGEVVAESRGGALGPYLGLRYPASDIPEQARALYLTTQVRAMADVSYEPVDLLADRLPDGTDRPPLDMSGCRLRSMSPIHRAYLRNMRVSASLVLSIVCDDRLWGLIACHHATPRALSLDAVQSMALVSEMISIRVQMLEEARLRRRLTARFASRNAILDRLHSADDLVAELAQSAERLTEMMRADGLAVRFGDDVWTSGLAPEREEVDRLMDRFGDRSRDGLYFTESLRHDLPDVAIADAGIAGAAAMQFRERDFIVFFREEQARSIRWGGDPHKAVSRDAAGRLRPRASFAEWVEQVEGLSRPWTEVDRRTADDFQKALAVFVLRRTRELKELNRRLRQKTDEIEQFVYSASHDLKSPLVTAQGFLGVLREDIAAGRYDELTDSIGRIERATETMGSFIRDLLAFSQIGRAGGEEPSLVDWNEVAAEVIEGLAPQIAAREATVEVVDRLPTLLCRPQDVFRVFDNLLRNSLKYACEGEVRRIEIGCRSQPVEHVVTVRDWGGGIPPEYHAKAMQLFQRVHTQKEGTGIGLASVAKIVELIGGRVWLESPPDGGLAVRMALPRDFPDAS